MALTMCILKPPPLGHHFMGLLGHPFRAGGFLTAAVTLILMEIILLLFQSRICPTWPGSTETSG